MTVQYVIDFGFVDISCLVISGQAKAMPVWRVLKVTHQGPELGVKFDVYDSLVVVDIVILCMCCNV